MEEIKAVVSQKKTILKIEINQYLYQLLEFSSCQDSDAKLKMNDFSNEFSSRSLKHSTECFMEEMKPEVVRKDEFEK